MRIRKLGEVEWVDVELGEDDFCVFCEVARGSLKAPGQVIYFETEAGTVQRTECVGVASDGSAGFLCWESSREEAAAELVAETCGVCFAPPGVECNKSPGWCGAIDAGAHPRAPLANACDCCRGTGLLTKGVAPALEFETCTCCDGQRVKR